VSQRHPFRAQSRRLHFAKQISNPSNMNSASFRAQPLMKTVWCTDTVELELSTKANSNDSKSDIKQNSITKTFRKLLHKLPNPTLRKSREQGQHPLIEGIVPQNPQATLLGCPGEIRNLIYRYLFADDPIEGRLSALHNKTPFRINKNTHVLLVCHQIYREASNLARPNFALIPKHFDLNVKCVAGLTLPMNNLHIARILQGATPPEYIRTLVLRDDLHDLNLYWEPPSGLPSMKIHLRAETLILQLCICNSFMWTAGLLEGVTIFGLALAQVLQDVPSLQRVVVYFCSGRAHRSIEPPRGQFPHAVVETMRARGSWKVKQWSEDVPGAVRDHEATLTPSSPSREPVQLEFYNSLSTSARYCVLK
jgi:hypothetical protein